MTNPSTELATQRRQTTAYIASAPTVVTLTPSTRTKTTSGGWKYVDQPARDPQTFKLITVSPSNPRPTVTQDGEDQRIDYVLVGEYDAQVAVGDWWTSGGRKFRVMYLFPDNGYEVRAGVSVHAGP